MCAVGIAHFGKKSSSAFSRSTINAAEEMDARDSLVCICGRGKNRPKRNIHKTKAFICKRIWYFVFVPNGKFIVCVHTKRPPPMRGIWDWNMCALNALKVF